MVRTFRKVYGTCLLFFVSARTNKRHHHLPRLAVVWVVGYSEPGLPTDTSAHVRSHTHNTDTESVLFIGTQFSNFYTAVDITPPFGLWNQVFHYYSMFYLAESARLIVPAGKRSRSRQFS